MSTAQLFRRQAGGSLYRFVKKGGVYLHLQRVTEHGVTLDSYILPSCFVDEWVPILVLSTTPVEAIFRVATPPLPKTGGRAPVGEEREKT